MICLICNQEFNPVGSHLRKRHQLTSKEYFDKYIDSDGEKKKCLQCFSPLKHYYSITRGYSHTKSQLCFHCAVRKALVKYKNDEDRKEANSSRVREAMQKKRKYSRQVICQICNLSISQNDIYKHTKDEHSVDETQYKHTYIYPNLPIVPCHVCGNPRPYSLSSGRKTPYLRKCCTNYSAGALKREKKFKEIFINGKTQKQHIMEKTSTSLSASLKGKIARGEYTPNIQNRLTHKKNLSLSYQGENINFRSSWELLFWYHHKHLKHEATRVTYTKSDGNEHVYITDFTGINKFIVYEIKPYNLTKDDNFNKKILGLRKWCEKNNYTYIIITEWYLRYVITNDFIKFVENNFDKETYRRIHSNIKQLAQKKLKYE